jgi:hypothetical protein
MPATLKQFSSNIHTSPAAEINKHTNKYTAGIGHPMTCICKHRGEVKPQLLSIRNPALDGGGASASRPSRLAPGKKPDVQLTRGLFASGLLLVQYSFKRKKYTPPKSSYL